MIRVLKNKDLPFREFQINEFDGGVFGGTIFVFYP